MSTPRPRFTAFVRLRPDARVEDEVMSDPKIVQPSDPIEPTTQSADVPWAAPSDADLDALVEEVVALVRAPLPLTSDRPNDDLKEEAA